MTVRSSPIRVLKRRFVDCPRAATRESKRHQRGEPGETGGDRCSSSTMSRTSSECCAGASTRSRSDGGAFCAHRADAARSRQALRRVLCDLMMPGTTGIEFFDEVRATLPLRGRADCLRQCRYHLPIQQRLLGPRPQCASGKAVRDERCASAGGRARSPRRRCVIGRALGERHVVDARGRHLFWRQVHVRRLIERDVAGDDATRKGMLLGTRGKRRVRLPRGYSRPPSSPMRSSPTHTLEA